MVSILTKQQKLALKLLSETDTLKQFYFSGGTALSYYYLQHRKSEDLDFFCSEEFEVQGTTVMLKSLQKKLGFVGFDFQNSMNRNLYFLKFSDEYVLKLEFTYYPFQQIEKPSLRDGLNVDSVIDIAANKLFTISQKPRGRDYYDLFRIIKKYKYDIEKLRMLAKQKFDWHIDPLQIATRFDEIDSHLDDPILTDDEDLGKLTPFFQKEALKLRDEIISE